MKARTLRLSRFSIVLCAATSLVIGVRTRGQSALQQPALEIQAAQPAPKLDPQVNASADPSNPPATSAASPKTTTSTTRSANEPPIEARSTAAYYEAKMTGIVFPSVALNEANVDEAIDFLRTKSRDYDQVEKDPSKKGVNIVLKKDAATESAKITLNLRDVPMSDVLRYVTQLAGMAYKIEPFAVVVMPLSEWNAEVDVEERSPQHPLETPTLGLPRAISRMTAAKPLQSASKPPVQTTPAGAYYTEKMRKIVFPNVEFKGASVNEAIEIFRTQSQDYDNVEKDSAKRGVNIVLKHDTTTPTASITLSLRDVPMIEALKYVTQLAGMAYKIEPFAVVVMPLSEWNTQLHTRIFQVPPDFLTANATEEEPTATDILKSHGILFPAGASARFIPSACHLVVRNTEPELLEVESLLQTMAQVSPAPARPTKIPPASDRVGKTALTGEPGPPSVSFTAPAPGAMRTKIVAVEGGRLRAMTPGGDLFFEATSPEIDGRAVRGFLSARTQQILRDTELRVLMRHLDATVSEITDGEKTLLSEANVANHEALEAKLKALREWKARLEGSINRLVGAAGESGEKLELGNSDAMSPPASASR